MAASCIRGAPLRTERLSTGRRKLLCDLIVEIPSDPSGTEPEKITVSSGFDTDFSSLPTFLQWVVHWSKVDVAGVVHDWLYANGAERKRADRIWRILALSGEHHASRLKPGSAGLVFVCSEPLPGTGMPDGVSRNVGAVPMRSHVSLRCERGAQPIAELAVLDATPYRVGRALDPFCESAPPPAEDFYTRIAVGAPANRVAVAIAR